MKDGWVPLQRELLSDPIMYKPGLLQLYIFCLLRANYKTIDGYLFNDGIVKIERGSFITGRKVISKDLKCNETTIYKRLRTLEKSDYIRITSTNKYSIITVSNYDKYQSYFDRETKPKRRNSNNKKEVESIDNTDILETEFNNGNNEVTTKEQQSNTNNKDNKENKEKYISVKTNKPCLFKDSPEFKPDMFKKKFNGNDKNSIYWGADTDYYYEKVKNWSEARGIKRIDWAATARGFFLEDIKHGKEKRRNTEPGMITLKRD